jgi:hypothetical protein
MEILNLTIKKKTNLAYSAVGLLKEMAEIRELEPGIERSGVLITAKMPQFIRRKKQDSNNNKLKTYNNEYRIKTKLQICNAGPNQYGNKNYT